MSGVWKGDACVDIAVGDSGPEARTPETVCEVFQRTVRQYGDRAALRSKQPDGVYSEITWTQYFEQCALFARALLHLNVAMHRAVNILGFNSPEWLVADVGTILAGGMAAGIYASNGPDACRYISHHSEAPVVVVEGAKQLDKYMEILTELPKLQAIVVWGFKDLQALEELDAKAQKATGGRVKLYTFEAFLDLGKLVASEELDERMAALRPGHCCTLVYTSGTTGPPKAVMTSHDNLTHMCTTVVDVYPGIDASSHAISFLPLSHIAAQMMDIHLPMFLGCPLTFCGPNALKGGLLETLTDVRPTFILAVPRVWEKMMEALNAKLANEKSALKKAIVAWAFAQGKAHGQREQYRKTGALSLLFGRFKYWLADKLLLRKIRAAMGLDKCPYCVTGAAPISLETLEFFAQLGIPLYEVYGQSETTGPHTATSIGRWKMGTAGSAWPGTMIRIDDKTGEIQSRGRQVFMGYLNDEESTRKVLLSDGWFASGDIGKFDDDGFLSITGRLKELIITAGGENVPPALIEDALKTELPALSNVVVIGDKRKYLTFLCTLRVTHDEHGAPTDKLDHIARQEAQAAGCDATTIAEARNSAEFRRYIEAGIKRANARATSHAQYVQKFLVLPYELSMDSGELTPTLKVKRNVVLSKHSDEIDRLYS